MCREMPRGSATTRSSGHSSSGVAPREERELGLVEASGQSHRRSLSRSVPRVAGTGSPPSGRRAPLGWRREREPPRPAVRHRGAGRSQRGDRLARAQRPPRRLDRQPGRRCSPRWTSSATSGRCGCAARSGLVGLVVPELDNPIFPAFAQVMETLLAQHGLHAGAVHPDSRRRDRGRIRRPPARPWRCGDHLRLGHARRRHGRPRRLPLPRRPRPADRPRERLRRGHRRALHLRRRRRRDGPRGHPPGVDGASPHRPGASGRCGSCRSSASGPPSSRR